MKRDETDLEERIAALLARPYTKVIQGDSKERFLALAPELPGCVTAGETEEEAIAMLRDAMAGWFESALRRGRPIPQPYADPVTGQSGSG